MIIKEEKNLPYKRVYKTIYLDACPNNFIILNDSTSKINFKIRKIFKKINKYNYHVKVLNIKRIAKRVEKYVMKQNLDFDTILTAGEGGKQFFIGMRNSVNKNVIYLKWHRIWNKDKSFGFESDIDNYDLTNKKILIMEDVIASGNTLINLINDIEKRNGQVVGICASLIQETSPLIKMSIKPTIVGVKINKTSDTSLDPFWYPPIYSLRHLLWGDKEMPLFYQILNAKYFQNNNDIETLIKKVRKDL